MKDEEDQNKWATERAELEQQLAELRSDNRQLKAELDILLSVSEEQERIEQKETAKLLGKLHHTQLQATKYNAEQEAAKQQIIALSKEVEEFSKYRQQYLEQIQSNPAGTDAGVISDLQTELAQARSEAAEQLEEAKIKLQDALTKLEQHDGPGIQAAEMEGLRQEVDQLHRSIRERDQELEHAIGEQRSLEDALEDRDAHLEQIKQKIQLTKVGLEDADAKKHPPEEESVCTAITTVPFLNQQETSGDHGKLNSLTKPIFLGILIGAILCFGVLNGLMVLTGKGEIITTPLGAASMQNQAESQPSPTPPNK
ncbi:hypothetical protein MNBD_GAMMA26-1610 [hydrothermal vent metagenome]|uniref:WH2 domain-containing protein n=1 Tax=hydrothermal vent metagenome TaxID=652676 RepID=A0A3B1B0N1_9ZZZZ